MLNAQKPNHAFTWWMLQCVFTLSGACGLSYEIIWGRWLATVIGCSSTSASIVLATFMGGLAAGSWVFGRICRRLSSPLGLYAGIEFLIGISAIIFPAISIKLLGLPFALRVLGVIACLFPPTFFMGGTVPLAMSWSESVDLPAGATLGRLYGVNTLGACFGSLAAGFWLIPAFGLRVTNGFAATLNLFIALIVVLMQMRRAPVSEKQATAPASQAAQPFPAHALHYVVFLSGFVTFGLEVIWIRLLRITLGSTTYTFTMVVATFILGIGVGGLLAGYVREKAEIAVKLAHAQWLLITGLLLQFLILPVTPHLFRLGQQGAHPWRNAMFSSTAACVVSLLPVAVIVGYLFPLVGRLYMRRGQRGSEIGALYAINTVGSVLGSIVTAALFVPLLGSAWSFLLCIALMLTSLSVYVRLARGMMTVRFFGAIFAQLLVFLLLAFFRPGWTPEYLARGAFRRHEPIQKLLFFHEGTSSTVLVEEVASGRGMLIDGKPVASTVFIDRVNQVLLGHLPALLTPTLRQGMVIGLGTGMTLDALAQHHLARVDIVELEEGVFQGAQMFRELNHAVLDRPEVVKIVDDGLNYLHAVPWQYDVITSDPIQPFFRGASTLYSTDYFLRAAQRLAPDGVMAHWLPLAQMSVADFKMIVRSFTDVFPYARLYWTGGMFDTILVGKNAPWTAMSPEQFAYARADLRDVYIERLEEAEELLIAERDVLVRWAGDGLRNTIDQPFLEFTAPKNLFTETGGQNLRELMAMRNAAARNSDEWKAVSILLAYLVNVRPIGDIDLLQHALWNAAGCAPERADCPMIARSGLIRRQAWELAMRQGEQAFLRYRTAKAFDDSLKPSGEVDSTDPFLTRQLETSIAAFEVARRLLSASRADEQAMFRQQIAQLQRALAPDSPEASRVKALGE